MKTFTHVGMLDNDGLEFGLDSVTPVSWAFYDKAKPHIRYCYQLPVLLVEQAVFQKWANEARVVTMSHRALVLALRAFLDPIPVISHNSSNPSQSRPTGAT